MENWYIGKTKWEEDDKKWEKQKQLCMYGLLKQWEDDANHGLDYKLSKGK